MLNQHCRSVATIRTRLQVAVLLLATSAGPWTASALAQATTNPALPKPAPAAITPRAPLPANPGWWNDAVFYEVFVRSFADSTTGPLANDGIGDLQGLIEKLDYLNDGNPTTTTDLGVTALWLMPVTASPSYHGYDTTDYQAINPQYGTNDDFKRLMTECHRRGIKVVVDMVLNHSSNQHPWFKRAEDPASPEHDWYVWVDEIPVYKGPWNQGVWHSAPGPDGKRRAKGNDGKAIGPFYYGLFSPEMPDLNYNNPAVTKAMYEVSRVWLQEMNADGFRLDAVRHLIEDGPQQDNTPATHAWLKDYHTFLKGISPQSFTVGEVWAPSEDASQYVGDQLDTVFEFDLAHTTLESINAGNATKLASTLERVLKLYPENQYCTFLTNHDEPRVMTNFLKASGGDAKIAGEKATLAAALLFVLPGVPFIYYGEEIGMVGDKPDPEIRTPMQWTAGANAGFSASKPWSKPNPDYTTVNVAAQTESRAGGGSGSLSDLYRKLIRFRQESPALLKGSCTPIVLKSTDPATPDLFAFSRQMGGQTCVVYANLSDKGVDPAKVDWSAMIALDAAHPAKGASRAFKLCENGRPAFGVAPDEHAAMIPARSVYVIRSER